MKNRYRFVVLLTLLCSVVLLPQLLAQKPGSPAETTGGTHHEDRISKLTRIEKNQLADLRTLSSESLTSIVKDVGPEELAKRTKEILALDSLCIGSRSIDAEGRAQIHKYLSDQISKLEKAGLENVGSFKGTAVVPVSVNNLLDASKREEPSSISNGSQSWPVTPMWPNGAMPSICPEAGLKGRLIDVKDGSWENLKGVDINGSIALMNFSGGRNFERLFSLGCQGIVVIEDDYTVREKAERLFCNTPVPFPRFCVNKVIGAELRAQANGSMVFTLKGGNIYEKRPFESLFAYLPPSDQLEYVVRSNDLLERIATEKGISTSELIKINELKSGDVETGKKLIIPNDYSNPYTVVKDDLITRLGDEYSVPGLVKFVGEPKAGDKITIPNLAEPMVILVPIDSVNVAPDQPHGARIASNLAIALTMMEHLANAPAVQRRKGVLFGFLDGESTGGGLTSRLLAENVLTLQPGALEPYDKSKASDQQAEYQAADDWMNDRGDISEENAQWLEKNWLITRVEDQRVKVAEEISALFNKISSAKTEVDKAEQKNQKDRREKVKDYIIKLRDSTIENQAIGRYKDRITAFKNRMIDDEKNPPFDPMPFSWTGMKQRLRMELDQFKAGEATKQNNNKLVKNLWDKIHPGMWKNDAPQNANPVLGWYLDFSWGTQAIGVKSKSGSDMRLSSPYAGAAGAFSKRIANVNSYASVLGKWQEQWTTPTDEDTGEFPISSVEEPPSYPEFWAKTGVGLLAMGTLNDTMETIDTPRDTYDNVNFDNLSVQARTALTQIQVGLESQIDSPSPGAKNFGVTKFSRVTGKALRFNLRSGIDAQDPVPDTLVYYPGIRSSEAGSQNTSTYRGVRKGIPLITMLNGSYTLPLESLDYGSKPVVFGFHLDRKTGLFDRIVDQGQIGTQVKDPKFKMIEGKEVVKDLIVTDVYPKVFFPEPDPVDYAAMGDSGDNQLTTIYDGLLNGVPQHYAYINPAVDYSETDINSNIVLMPPGRSMRVATQKSIIYKLLLTGEVTAENAKGKGYYVGPLPDGDRNLSLPLTTLLVAKDMYNLAVRQNDKFSSHGISDKVVMASTDRAKEKLDEARAKFDQKDWQAGNGAAREAWGILVKVYPSILTLGREAVFSVIILMALLLPACIFLEKLIVGSKGIMTQLLWTAGLFSLGVIFLNFFHPAFQISVSPFIVMISFIMILMSSVVLLISYQRFEVLVRRARAAGGEVEGEEISLMSSLSTALSLGVSNLKKRPSRTFLTTLTVSVLTFSIISFVSVKGQEEIFRRAITLDQVDGQDKTPEKPAYAGVLFRNFYWTELSNSFLSAIYSEYGTRYEITTRGFYIQAEGGNNADRENVNIINVQFGKKKAVITALMGFQPNEVSFSKLNEAVTKKSWFRAEDTANKKPADRFTVILPDRVAKELGITEDMIFDAAGNRKANEELPTVSMKNYSWKVIGILNTKQADRIRDINGKSLAIVDFLRSGFTKNVGNAGELLNEQVSYQMKWDVLAIVPMSVQSETQIRPRAVAIRFKGDDKKNVDTFFNDVKLRMNRAMFVGNSDGTVQIVTTKKQSNIGGLAKIIVPVILCILIVLNTMMGTVDERKGEVGMLGAIGLSPAQISFLLLSESAVYSVLGIIFGTFTGLLFGWFTTHSSSLSGLSVNFTSLSSIALAMGTGLIVLIATIVPARRAAMLAAPSGMESWELPTPSDDMKIHFALPFTLTRGNAVGMLAFFRRFLSNHTESTSEDFNCRNIRINQDASEDPALVVRADMWLAPYDLDVAQHLIMRVSPTENEGVFGVMILLERTSGTEEAWLRTNYAFMNMVRHQFLLWRNLDNASRLKYIAEGAQLFQEAGQ